MAGEEEGEGSINLDFVASFVMMIRLAIEYK
jgi:hypothetical protein